MKAPAILTLALSLCVTLCMGIAAPTSHAADHKPSPKVLWDLDGFKNPESAYYDAASGVIFVSNVNGKPLDKDNNGYISKLSVDGKVLKEKWAEGLHAPKGLRSVNGVLYVSDIDRLVGFNISDGKKVVDVTQPNAKFLNDVATSLDGRVFVSDMLDSKVYELKGGKLVVFAKGEKANKPNGLLVSGTRLLIASIGKKADRQLHAIDLRTGALSLVAGEPVDALDGLEVDGRGNYLVSSWPAGKLWRVSPKGKTEVILSMGKGTADFGFIQETGVLILPRMVDNHVTAYQVAPPLFDGMKEMKLGDGLFTEGNWATQKDGSIKLVPRKGEKGWTRYNMYLWLDGQYENFEANCEYRFGKGGNSGFYFRVGTMKDPVGKGIEVQILDSYNKAKQLGHHDHGGIIKTGGPTHNMSIPHGHWNRLRVKVKGGRLTVVLNGEQVQDLDLSKSAVKDRPAKGYIGIQDHGLVFEVRNVRIKKLD